MKDDSAKLGTESVPKLVFGFSLTVLAGLLLNSVYTLTDALFISHAVGDTAMGGVSLILPFTILQGAISTTVGSGASAIVSRKLGEGKPGDAGAVTVNAMAIFYLTAILTTALGFLLMNPLLKALGCTGSLEAYAREYFMILLIGNVFSTGFSSIIRAEGKMVYGMLIWVIPITLNIALDALFLFGLDLGVKGSAWATVIGQFASFSMSVFFFTRLTGQQFKGAKLSRKTAAEIVGIGLPSLIQSGSLSVLSAMLNHVLARVGGEAGVTAFAYIVKIVTFALSPLTAFAMSLVPIAGYNFGAKKFDRVRQTARFCLLAGLLYGALAALLLWLITSQILGLFTENAALVATATRGLRLAALTLPFTAIPMTTGALYQSLGKKAGAFVLFASTLIFTAPLLWFLPDALGLDGVWFAYLAANVLAAVLGAILLWRVRKTALTD